MATTATIEQIESIEDVGGEDKFRLAATITAVGGDTGFGATTLFVYLKGAGAVDTDTYAAVAPLGVRVLAPTDRSFVGEGEPYRTSVMQVDYDRFIDAHAEQQAQLVALQTLVDDWEDYADAGWDGATEVTVVSSP